MAGPNRGRAITGAVVTAATVAALVWPPGNVKLVFEQTSDLVGTNPTQYSYEWKAISRDQYENDCYSDWNLGAPPPDRPSSAQTLRNGVWVGGGYAKGGVLPEQVYRCDKPNRRVYVIAEDDSTWLFNPIDQSWIQQGLPQGAVPIPLVETLPDVTCDFSGQTQGDTELWNCETPFVTQAVQIPPAKTIQLYVRSRYKEYLSPWSNPYTIGNLAAPQNPRLEERVQE